MEKIDLIERGFDFERALVDTVVEMYMKMGESHAWFARQLYPDVSDPFSKWSIVRNPHSTNKKPKRVTLAEAHAYATILRVDFASLAFRVQERMKL